MKITQHRNPGARVLAIVMVLAAGLLLGSCTKRSPLEGPQGDEATVRLTVTVPGASLPRGAAVRSGAADPEYRVSEVRILVFTQQGVSSGSLIW